MSARFVLILTLAVFLPTGLLAQDNKDESPAKAKALVEKKLQVLKADGAKVQVIEEKYVREMFPSHVFVAVHFPIWPVARVAPEPMQSQNLFAVSRDGKLTHLADNKKLEEFFKATLKPPFNPEKTTRSWLRLRMEYLQDGYYKFKYPAKINEGPLASSVTILFGVVEVAPEMGNKGTFTATLRFVGQSDQFASVSEDNKVIRGIRPRCQATLLLHPERIVREIAEQDLLVMGRNARGYLLEQRAKASHELRREIDRVWRQIEAEGR